MYTKSIKKESFKDQTNRKNEYKPVTTQRVMYKYIVMVQFIIYVRKLTLVKQHYHYSDH